MVDLCLSDLSEVHRLITSWGCRALQLFWLCISSGTGSSHPRLLRYSSCRMVCLLTTGATKLSRSKMELMVVDNIPRRVHGLSLTEIVNLNASDYIHHWTPKVCSMGKASQLKSKCVIPSALSETGICSITSFLFDVNLCRLKSPCLHISLVS